MSTNENDLYDLSEIMSEFNEDSANLKEENPEITNNHNDHADPVDVQTEEMNKEIERLPDQRKGPSENAEKKNSAKTVRKEDDPLKKKRKRNCR